MNPRLYFSSTDDECCYPLSYHMDVANEGGLTEIELFEAVPEKVDGIFFCREINEMGEDGSCGRICADYAPKNGKSGMCRHRHNRIYWHGNKSKFTVR
jgi:hypothetical protein